MKFMPPESQSQRELMMAIRVKTGVSLKIDRKQWDRMQKRLLAPAGNKAVEVGWWRSMHSSGVPVAQVAAWNEEGHFNGGMFAGTYTPPRPFIRHGFIPLVKKDLSRYYSDINKIAMGTLSWQAFYLKMSKMLVATMQQTILEWDTPPNSPTTIGLKGFNDPLMNTGNMYEAIKHRIVRGTN